jgi:uncharacterized membrane protein
MKETKEQEAVASSTEAKAIINSSFIKQSLQQQSLKDVLSSLTGKVTSEQKNPLEKVQEAIGIASDIQVEKTVIIERSVEELYQFWRDFSNLPQFMHHLRSVTTQDESQTRTHWIANAPLNATVEWDAEIVLDEPPNLIAWTSLENANINNCGLVRFQSATGNRGTEVKVVLEYQPPGGKLTDAIAKLFGQSPEQQIGDELNHFKQLMETGEIPTTKGQPQGS